MTIVSTSLHLQKKHFNDRKRIAESDVSFDKKARIDFDSLIKDIKSFSASSESHTAKKVVPLHNLDKSSRKIDFKIMLISRSDIKAGPYQDNSHLCKAEC